MIAEGFFQIFWLLTTISWLQLSPYKAWLLSSLAILTLIVYVFFGISCGGSDNFSGVTHIFYWFSLFQITLYEYYINLLNSEGFGCISKLATALKSNFVLVMGIVGLFEGCVSFQRWPMLISWEPCPIHNGSSSCLCFCFLLCDIVVAFGHSPKHACGYLREIYRCFYRYYYYIGNKKAEFVKLVATRYPELR